MPAARRPAPADIYSQALFVTSRGRSGQGKLQVKSAHSALPGAPLAAAGRVYAAMTAALGRQAPVVPAMISGFTDSRYFRERGIAAYGLSPFVLDGDDQRGIHSTDERIPVAELDRGVERTRQLLSFYVSTGHSDRLPAK